MASSTSATPEPALSPAQLETYLAHIGLSSSPSSSSSPPRKPNLPFLAQLLEHHISAIPYENLGMHYSPSKVISLDIQVLYDKYMSGRGRGGYCLENTIFFNHVLRALGFVAWVVGARARPRVEGIPRGDYTGWLHTVNIVKFTDGSKYMVDVAFGGDLSTKPLLLQPGIVTPNLGSQQVRLERASIPGSLSGEKQWIYQFRNGPPPGAAATAAGGKEAGELWHACFAFTGTEFLPADLEVMNAYTSRDERCFLAGSVLVVRFLRHADGDEAEGRRPAGIYGKRMLVNHEIKEFVAETGKTTVIRTCKTEDERVEALKELLGIELTEEEKEAVRGSRVEL